MLVQLLHKAINRFDHKNIHGKQEIVILILQPIMVSV